MAEGTLCVLKSWAEAWGGPVHGAGKVMHALRAGLGAEGGCPGAPAPRAVSGAGPAVSCWRAGESPYGLPMGACLGFPWTFTWEWCPQWTPVSFVGQVPLCGRGSGFQ